MSTRRGIRIGGAILAAIALEGCASSVATQEDLVRPETTVRSDRAEATEAAETQAQSAPTAERAEEVPSGEANTPTPAASVETREDGRPSWWFDGIEESAGTLRLCAESLGKTMREARANAVAAAHRKVGDRPDIDLGASTVELVSVMPTPHRSTGGARYVGFVLLDAPIAGGVNR